MIVLIKNTRKEWRKSKNLINFLKNKRENLDKNKKIVENEIKARMSQVKSPNNTKYSNNMEINPNTTNLLPKMSTESKVMQNLYDISYNSAFIF